MSKSKISLTIKKNKNFQRQIINMASLSINPPLTFNWNKKGTTTTFNQPIAGKWFNLATGRTLSVKSKTKGRIYVESSDPNYPRIAGTVEQINEFFTLNPTITRDLSVEGGSSATVAPTTPVLAPNLGTLSQAPALTLSLAPVSQPSQTATTPALQTITLAPVSTPSAKSTPSIDGKFKYRNKKNETVEFNQPDEGKWFNLGSGRILSKQTKNKIFVISSQPNYPRIAGTTEQLAEFFQLNPSIKRDLEAEGQTTPVEGPKVNLSKMERFMSEHRKLRRLTDLLRITRKPVREGLITPFKDPAQLTVFQVNQLDIFSLEGFKGQFRISRVFDGDTFDLVFFLPMNLLKQKGRKGGRKGLATSQSDGFFWKLKCRLFGYDAQEHDRWEGICAAYILFNKLKALNGNVYGKIGATYKNPAGRDVVAPTYGKFGRVLVDIYLDPQYKRRLVDEVFNNYTGNLSELETFIDTAPRILNRDKLVFKTALGEYRKNRVTIFTNNVEKFKSIQANQKYITPEFLKFESDFKRGKYILGVDYYGETKNKAMDQTPLIPKQMGSMFYKIFNQMSVISDK